MGKQTRLGFICMNRSADLNIPGTYQIERDANDSSLPGYAGCTQAARLIDTYATGNTARDTCVALQLAVWSAIRDPIDRVEYSEQYQDLLRGLRRPQED